MKRMTKHFRYLSYLVRHKWYVMLECFREGLIWRGIIHDWHKFLPSEWFPYVEYFYGDADQEKFDYAWLLHQKKADHHWQWYILREDDGAVKSLPMSHKARLEMLCDWCGASKAQGHGSWDGVYGWYDKNGFRMRLNPETRVWVEDFLRSKNGKE